MLIEIQVTPTRTSRDLKEFLKFPWKVQAADPVWVPPLLIDVKSRLSPKHPFYEHGEVQSFLARDAGGETLGRISAFVNRQFSEIHHESVGFFGFFECVNNPAVARALIDHAGNFLRERGLTTVRGPGGFTIYDEWGTLVEGFDTPPAVMMPHNPPYYNDLLEACGFIKAKDVLAYQMFKGQLSDRVIRIAEKLEGRLKMRIRPFNKKEFWKEVDRILEVFNNAWEANWGYVPLTDKELHVIAESLKLMYDPRLVFMAESEDGKPVGFSLAIPDVNVLLKKVNGRLFPTGIITLLTGMKKVHRARVMLMGVHRDFRARGIDTVFYYKTYMAGIAAGYDWAEFSWVLEDNQAMNEAALSMGSRPYKRWRVWEKPL
jgi:hypothetical protein